ncbi:hypothetical protein [Aquimarina sediminis]|uniref:hypothetical protein n=1 Tax=Aquimarina sediminis TaxID=2070536 RepID=UPI000FFF2B03|nr:hypothetical protein [Aquimarina sediminis]
MQFAILISVLVALLLGAFLLLTHVHSFFRIKSKELVQAFEQSNTRIFESLNNGVVTGDTIVTVQNLGTIKEMSGYHGAWLKQYTEIGVHDRKVARVVFTGVKISETTPNLYLEETNSPLVVVGNTRLEGNSYLPKQGIKAGNISGNYYQGSALHYGRVLKSKTILPELEPDWITYLEGLAQGVLIDKGESMALKKELKNSFHDPVHVIYNADPIFLEDEKITGNIVIQSRTKIVVGSQTQLMDVVLIAPEIIIKNGVNGSFQGIATKKIKVGKRCHLSYPSAMILLDQKVVYSNSQNNQLQNDKPDFMIEEGTMIEGVIVYLNKNKDKKAKRRLKTNLEIAPNVEIVGETYCQGNIDFQGKVLGSLYARQYIARQSGSVYLNHIYNGKILINPVVDYAGLPFVNSKNTIAKWLY